MLSNNKGITLLFNFFVNFIKGVSLWVLVEIDMNIKNWVEAG